MAINISGGMANARAKQLAIRSSKELLKRQRRRKKSNARRESPQAIGTIDEAGEYDADEFVQDIAVVQENQTRLGNFLDFTEPFVIALIIINAIMMGLGTFNFVTENPKVDDMFELSDQIFLIIFTVEVSLNFIHYIRADRIDFTGGKMTLPPALPQEAEQRMQNKPWLIFDASVVILSWAFSSLSVVRAFRILRVLRLISKVEKMKAIVQALMGIAPKMGVVAFLLVILFLVFGIGFTTLFKDLYKDGYTRRDYFSRLDLTSLTLFQMMTFDNWHTVARECMVKYPLAWVPFLTWNVITGFVVVNLIIAIICESLVNMNEEKEMKDEEATRRTEYAKGLSGMGSTRSIVSDAYTANTVDYVFRIEDTVDAILRDQEVLMKTVEDLKEVLKEVLEKGKVPNETRRAEIIKLLSF